jgi:hypothetical protein
MIEKPEPLKGKVLPSKTFGDCHRDKDIRSAVEWFKERFMNAKEAFEDVMKEKEGFNGR